MQKDVLAEDLAEAAAFIGKRFANKDDVPLEFRMCGLLRYFLLTHDAAELDYDALCSDISALRSRFEARLAPLISSSKSFPPKSKVSSQRKRVARGWFPKNPKKNKHL